LPRARLVGLRLQDASLRQLDQELDMGLGECWVHQPEIASLVEGALFYFDLERYRLLAWCLMPNHVHVVIEMRDGPSLSEIVGSWKSFTAKRANAQLGRSGPFWDADYFDRYMRNEDHLARTVDYVEQNPVKAGLVDVASKWPWSSARFRLS
jgi:REP element-mobilizing transposase RayT